jgi:hypothetical protein
LDVAAEPLRQFSRNRQSQPSATRPARTGRRDLSERFKDGGHLVRRHADSGVAHPKAELRCFFLRDSGEAGGHRYTAPFGELDRVADEVDEDLPQARGLALDLLRDRPVELQIQKQPLLDGAWPQERFHLDEDLKRRAGNPLDACFSRLDFGQVENITDNLS